MRTHVHSWPKSKFGQNPHLSSLWAHFYPAELRALVPDLATSWFSTRLSFSARPLHLSRTLDLHNTTRRQQQRWPLPSLLSASSRLRRSRPSVVACCARARLVRPADTHTAPYTSVWIEPPQRGSWDADADVFQVPRFPCPSRGTTPRVVPCDTSLPCDACTSTPVAAVPPTHADPSHPQTTCSSQISLNKQRRARARPPAA